MDAKGTWYVIIIEGGNTVGAAYLDAKDIVSLQEKITEVCLKHQMHGKEITNICLPPDKQTCAFPSKYKDRILTLNEVRSIKYEYEYLFGSKN